MIKKITLNKVASYKNPVTLETDKKINLIYGLNGTGKSTLSDYLYNKSDDKYKDCAIEDDGDDYEILVYNQSFIRDNFYEPESQSGIFTLSKENKEAETLIAKAQKEIKDLEVYKADKDKVIKQKEDDKNDLEKKSKDKIWEIKTNYSGNNSVLEYCLKDLKGSKDVLFNYITKIPKPNKKPVRSIEDLIKQISSISGENAQHYSLLNEIIFPVQEIETKELFQKQIVGNENSSIAGLIKELDNADWVQNGVKYLSDTKAEENGVCPFCQEQTISKNLKDEIINYFDKSYKEDTEKLNSMYEDYSGAIKNIPQKEIFEASPKYEEYKKDFEIKYNAFLKIIEDNLKIIEKKNNFPSVSIELNSSVKTLEELNEIIKKVNARIEEHNQNINEIDTVKKQVKQEFWEIMRWDYDPTITEFNNTSSEFNKQLESLNSELRDINDKIHKQNEIIKEQQRKTINIDEAINNINTLLIDLGITEFKIKKHNNNMYKIVRGEEENNIFISLSEGEKMIISFLYFHELCRGKKEATDSEKKKIIVIDDPISSLSHIYIFNIGRLIKNEFLGTRKTKTKDEGKITIEGWKFKYEQVFILTHSLYFFYEITERNHEHRTIVQKLFRLSKNSKGSFITSMKYEEIQNDYQAYWYIIKDENQPLALIANCMRNIIEYFFSFIEHKDLNNCFQDNRLKTNRFQAFNRYINRESHSIGQNITDIKEFNYQDLKDAFATLFEVTGYKEHYQKMIK